MSASRDRAALVVVVVVVVARAAKEARRARAYAPRDDAERARFAKGGATPRGKRLAMLAHALATLGVALAMAARAVTVPARARTARVDHGDAATRAARATETRTRRARVWIDAEGGEDIVRQVVKRRGLEDVARWVTIEAATPRRGEGWMDALATASDEDVDARMRARADENAAVYDFVVVRDRRGVNDWERGKFVVGTHRAAWMRFDDERLLADELEERLRALFAPAAETTPSASPFLTTSDGILLASFSLVNAEPTPGYAFSWDFQRDVEQPFLGALREALSRVLEVRIEAQVLRHARSRVRPMWSDKHSGYVVDSKQTPFFIDSDWPIDTSVTYTPIDGKPLHFVVYVPPQTECPLYVLDDNHDITATNAFLVEGWGGLVVVNPPGCAVAHGENELRLRDDEVVNVVNAFVRQLRIHLGAGEFLQKFGAKVLPPKHTGFATWEVDALVHSRLVADAQLTISTLKSLDEVISSISDIAVPEAIAEGILESVEALERAIDFAQNARYDEAGASARLAHAAAERAFFDPFSLGGLESFPFEYKVASVMPIMLPTIFPLILGFMREMRHFQLRRREAFRAGERSKKTS